EKGYHWATRDGKLVYRKNAGNSGPQRYWDEATKEFRNVDDMPKTTDGAKLAESKGLPPAQKGYHWAVGPNGEPVYKTNPGFRGPPRRWNPATKAFEDLPGSWEKYNYSDIGKREPCFAPGTLVRTPDGARRIDELAAGDLVMAYDTQAGALV